MDGETVRRSSRFEPAENSAVHSSPPPVANVASPERMCRSTFAPSNATSIPACAEDAPASNIPAIANALVVSTFLILRVL